SHLCNLQGIGAVGAGNAVASTGVVRQPFLQLTDLRPENVLAMLQHPPDARIYLLPDARLLGLQVDEVDHASASTRITPSPWRMWVASVCAQRTCPPPASGRSSCSPNSLIQPICRAGTPTIRAKAGTSRLITAPAPIKAYSPMVTPHTMVQFAPRVAP